MKSPFSGGKISLDELPIFEDYDQKGSCEYLVVRNGPDLSRARKLGWKPVARYASRSTADDERLVACERKLPKEN